MTFCIYGIIRGGKNHIGITRTGRRYPHANWAIWREGILRQLKNLVIQDLVPYDKPCKIVFSYWSGDHLRRDVPAMLDSLFHCFERAGIIKDDSLFKTVEWNDQGYDKKNPRVEIGIQEI